MYEDVIRSMGTVFDNRQLYGERHNVTIHSLEQAYELLTEALEAEEALLFTVTPDEFSINHAVVETKNNLIVRFVDMLRNHEVSTLTLSRGLTADEFLQLVDLVAQKPASGSESLGNRLNSESFPHIASKKVTFVELTEEDVVVHKDELTEMAARSQVEESVMEFLQAAPDASGRHTEEGSPPAITDNMLEMMTTPADLGEVIVKSAGLSLNLALPTDQPLNDSVLQELIARIVECLERAFQVLKEAPAARNQTGKNRLKKNLKTLGSDLETIIKSAVTQINDDELDPVYSAIDAMTDELEIDALAAEYLRKRRLIENSEQRLLKYMERQGDKVENSELKERLIEGGLSEFGWQMLVAATGNDPQHLSSKLSAESPEFRHLQEKLLTLTKIFNNIAEDSNASPEELEKIIGQVESQLEKLIKQTKQRIKRIMESIIADAGDADSRETESSRKLTRRQLLELIAEIVQELYQPLSVIQCVLQSMLTNRVCPQHIEQQQELLELAERSAQRMNMLIGEIYTVVGNPTSLTPAS